MSWGVAALGFQAATGWWSRVVILTPALFLRSVLGVGRLGGWARAAGPCARPAERPSRTLVSHALGYLAARGEQFLVLTATEQALSGYGTRGGVPEMFAELFPWYRRWYQTERTSADLGAREVA